MALVEINDQQYNIFNIYGPNDDDAMFFNTLSDEMTQIHGENIIIGGDFNVVLDVKIDKEGGRGDRKPKQRQRVQEMMKGLTQTREYIHGIQMVHPEYPADWITLQSQIILSTTFDKQKSFQAFSLTTL